MSPPGHRLPAVARGALVALGAVVPAAHADRYEASLGLGAHGTAARVGEPGATPAWTSGLGLDARATYATSNTWAYTLQLGAVVTQPVYYPDVERDVDGRMERGSVTRRTIAAALTAGAELRLGPRLVPTVRLAAGPQVRHRTASDLGGLIGAVPAETTADLVVSVGLGLDLRVDARRVLGLVLHFDHAQPLGDAEPIDTLGVALRFDRYWYPRWQAPAW